VGVFTLVMWTLSVAHWKPISVFLLATAWFPERRRMWVSIAALCWVVITPPVDLWLVRELAEQHNAQAWVNAWPLAVPISWLLAYAYLRTIKKYPRSVVARRPLVGLVALLFACIVATRIPVTGLAWVILISSTLAFGHYLWFFAYWILENAAPTRRPSLTDVGAWRPFWGFSHVPYAKGNAYLRQIEAKDDDQLLRSQLAALRLLAWAAVLSCVLYLGIRILYRTDGSFTSLPSVSRNALLPTYPMALTAEQAGRPYPWLIRWLAVIVHFLLRITALAIAGHKIVAICRMAGFNALRNTISPFLSTSIADFYNRVYYYFKELLVACFFFPTYLRYFKKHPRLRVVVATIAAAGLGNLLFHFLRDIHFILRFGFLAAVRLYSSYAVYAFVLASAIAISQLRQLGHRHRQLSRLGRIRALVGVLTFYAVVSVFEEPNVSYRLEDYCGYALNLFRPWNH
jgi:hypothetical protein